MILAIILLSVLLVAVSIALVVSLTKNLEYMDRMVATKNNVELSLNELKIAHDSLVNVSQTPVLSDEPVVRMLIERIYTSIKSVELVQEYLVYFDSEDEDE